jgi:long-chain acyl-CoA synthetase
MNLAAILLDSSQRDNTRMAVRLAEAGLTYGELDDASARVAGMLAERGIRPGDRVAIMLPNVPEFAVVYYGILRAGAIVVPMNPLLKTREVAYYLEDAAAKAIFAWHSAFGEAQSGADQAGAEAIVVDPGTFPRVLAAARAVPELVDRDADDTAIILYTSGTTGHPKGAELTHANLARNAEIVVTDLTQLTADDVIFGGLPLFHSFGQTCALNAAIATGACVTLLPRFDPQEALAMLARDGVTVLAGVPTMYVALLAHADNKTDDLAALRVCISGGAAMPVEVMKGFEEAFGCMVLEGYGLSETSPVACFNHPSGERKPGSIGTPIRGVEMRVIDSDGNDAPRGDAGEIAIRGHNVMKGYWGRPEATVEAIPDGWFRTGDIGRIDEDGYFSIVDRKKDLIIRGGYNVYPREIEEVLYEHPAVAEAAVIGVPHPELGEEIAAAVALKPGATATPRELRDYVKAQVAAYKYPRHVWLVDELPKGPTGKILKREIVPPADLLVS